jgi:hypothetical protein
MGTLCQSRRLANGPSTDPVGSTSRRPGARFEPLSFSEGRGSRSPRRISTTLDPRPLDLLPCKGSDHFGRRRYLIGSKHLAGLRTSFLLTFRYPIEPAADRHASPVGRAHGWTTEIDALARRASARASRWAAPSSLRDHLEASRGGLNVARLPQPFESARKHPRLVLKMSRCRAAPGGAARAEGSSGPSRCGDIPSCYSHAPRSGTPCSWCGRPVSQAARSGSDPPTSGTASRFATTSAHRASRKSIGRSAKVTPSPRSTVCTHSSRARNHGMSVAGTIRPWALTTSLCHCSLVSLRIAAVRAHRGPLKPRSARGWRGVRRASNALMTPM